MSDADELMRFRALSLRDQIASLYYEIAKLSSVQLFASMDSVIDIERSVFRMVLGGATAECHGVKIDLDRVERARRLALQTQRWWRLIEYGSGIDYGRRFECVLLQDARRLLE